MTTAVGSTRPERRRYESAVRREQAAETRRRIIAAGSELARFSDVRDWRGLTVRAVAQRAGVNERTIYRHFANERALRDAVMGQLQQEGGIDLDGMKLDDVAEVAARTLRQVSTFPLAPRQALDPTLNQANRRQHDALLRAVRTRSGRWSEQEQTVAAAMLDVLWSVATYERLVREWQLDPEKAIRAVKWVIRMVEAAIEEDEDRRPSHQS